MGAGGCGLDKGWGRCYRIRGYTGIRPQNHSPTPMHELASQFKALSEPVRLHILALLFRHGELCVCEVERFLDISQSKASRHLRYLLSTGLVQGRREGLWVYYRLTTPATTTQRRFFDALRELLAELPVPDISSELRSLRAERCHPAPPSGRDRRPAEARS